jgi:hypothetical protein
MPSLANLIVKKADGTTDITWSGLVAAAGDKSHARYASQTVNSIPAFQPKMSVRSDGNGDGSVRRVYTNVVYPYSVLDSTTNRTTLVSQASFRGEWAVPQDMPQANVDEFAAQVANLLDHTDMVSVVKVQTAPT